MGHFVPARLGNRAYQRRKVSLHLLKIEGFTVNYPSLKTWACVKRSHTFPARDETVFYSKISGILRVAAKSMFWMLPKSNSATYT